MPEEQKDLLADLKSDPEIVFARLHLKSLIVTDKLPPSVEFISSVRKFGILQAILVRPATTVNQKDGMYFVLDGRRRVLAAKIIGLKDVPALIVTDSSVLDGHVMTLEAQSQRSDNPISEYRAIKSLLSEGYTEAGIKDALGVSVDRMHKMLTLDVLDETILAGVQESKIAVTTAMKMAKLSKPYREELAEKFKKEKKLLGRDVAEVKQVIASESAQDVFELLDQQDFSPVPIADGEETDADKASRLLIVNPATEFDKGWNAALVEMLKKEG